MIQLAPATTDAPVPAARKPGLLHGLCWALAALLALLALAMALITWWLPGWLKPRVEQMGAQVLGTPVSVAQIELRPWALAARVDGLRIGEASAPLFQLGSAMLEISAESLWRRAPVLRSLTLTAPELWLQRSAEGRFNFQPVLDHIRAWQAKQPPSPPSDEPARYALHNLRLEGGRIHYRDDQLGQRHEVQALAIGLPFLSNLPSDVAVDVQPRLDAQVDGSTLHLGGHARPFATGRPAELALRWQGLPLAPWAGLLKAALPPEQAVDLTQGTLDTDLKLTFEVRPAPQVNRLQVTGQLTLSDLQARAAPLATQLAWRSLRLGGLDLAPLERRYQVAEVRLDGLDAQLTLDPAAPKPVPKPAPRAASSPAAAGPAGSAPSVAASAPGAPARAASAAPLLARIERLRCTQCRVAVTDRSVMPATRFTLQEADLSLAPLGADLAQPIQVDLHGQLATAVGAQAPALGNVALKGRLQPAPLALQAELTLADLDLRVIQPYLAPHLNLVLSAGRLGTQGTLTLAQPPTQPPTPTGTAPLAVGYQGRVALSDLRTQDSVNHADFIGWRQLSFDGLDVDWRANALRAQLGRIALDGLAARVILHPDAHLNLADIVKPAAQTAPKSITTAQATASAPTPTASAAATPATPSPHRIRWQGITLRNGAVHFSDNFIQPNYSARLTRLEGSLSALRSDDPQPATVRIAGALDDGAPLAIGGRIHPLGARLSTDIEASARGIALTRLSAYAERYAGYAIEKGSLSVKVSYKIEQGKLEAQNQLFLDQLTFGQEVDSPDATQLPVLLAVSLMKNRRGEIDIHLPVAGTLDDPQFSIGGVIWRLVLNLFEKALTAPFALLMGGDSSEAAQVDFAPGSAELTPSARERLDALAVKLADRPALKLEATGHADPQHDAAALLAASRPAKAAPAPAPSPASAPPASSAPSAAQLAAQAAALQALADRRADQVMAYLATRLPPERILITRSVVDAGSAVSAAGAAPLPASAAASAAAAPGGTGTSVQFRLH